MGNTCIKRKRRVVLEFDNVTNESERYIRGQKEDDLQSYDINSGKSSNIGRSQEGNPNMGWGKQSMMGLENNAKKDDYSRRPSNSSPSPSGDVHRKSHPLPTPVASQPQPAQNENSNKGFYPLPTPEPTPKVTNESSLRAMPRSESEILSSPNLKSFSFKELRRATSNFSKTSLLGEGGFGCVFRGWLDVETLAPTKPGSGMPVAIKKLIKNGFQGHNEWLSEVNYLGQLRHPNLVKLIGYCIDDDDRILVYEFMPGGSLERHLFRSRSPSLLWPRRIKIAVGAARGLSFLHQSDSPVIYRDFKTSNILLDSDFNAKLSDFGLARAGPTSESQTHITTRVMGTKGYCCPHYLSTGKLSINSDVYSFGVVLLELLTGHHAVDDTKFKDERELYNWVHDHVVIESLEKDNQNQVVEKSKIVRIMDTNLEGRYCKKSAQYAAVMALKCLNVKPKFRPPMTYVLEILENLPTYKNNELD